MRECSLMPEDSILSEAHRLVHGGRGQNLRHNDLHTQVKCDFDGGRKELGGTGNLFLQVKEANPFKLY